MKKLMIAASAALCATVGFSDVEGQNVVGYTSATLVPGLNMISDAFLKVGTDGKPLINELIKDQANVCNAAPDFLDGEADEILLYTDSIGYQNKNAFFFYAYPEEPDPYYDYKWCCEADNEEVGEESYEPTFRSVPVGKGFFYWNRGQENINISLSGQVSTQDAQWTIVPGLNLLSNPYPTDIKINGSFDWKALGAQDAADFLDGEADEILLYTDGIGYQNKNAFFFYAYPDEPDPYYDYKWCCDADNEEEGEESYEPTARSIPTGKGFFYWRRGATNMTIDLTSPIAE